MSDSLVRLEEFRYYVDAAAAKALLEVAGVRAFLDNRFSADIWTGAIGGTFVTVPAADLAKGREVIEAMRKVRQRMRAGGVSGELDACLACKKPMAAGQTTCAACGWTFAGDEWVDYANGPVAAALLPVAFSPLDSRRFGLPPRFVQNYVDWCEAEGLVVTGWELWRAGVVGHVVIDPQRTGSVAELLAAATTAMARTDEDVYFSINVARGEAAGREREGDSTP
jgi:hypothetical protein